MGYEFWNAKGNLKAAIEVGISPTEFSPKSQFRQKANCPRLVTLACMGKRALQVTMWRSTPPDFRILLLLSQGCRHI